MIVICLDGFRYDYLEKTKFLKSLMANSLYGHVNHGFGFSSEFSAITGKDNEELGIVANNFIRSKNGLKFYSFFSFIERFKSSRLFLDIFYNTKEFLVGNNQPKSIFQVPLRYSKYFNFLIKKNFFSQSVMGNPTIFESIKDKQVVGYMWPFIYKNNKTRIDLLNFSKSTANTDDRAFQKSLDLVKTKPDLAYIHFFSTDNLVHKLGVDSKTTLELIRKLDNFVEQLSKHTDSLLIFSDHGMVEVKDTWNLWKEVDSLGFSYGDDYIMFLDSTLARFWFKNSDAEQKIKDLFIKSRKGRIVDFKNKSIHNLFGELIFQVNPGTLILPNFYQDKADKATHGYSDSCKEERAFYIFHKEGMKPWKKDIKMKDIYNLIIENMK
jgi:hypothetical protein